MISKFNTFHCVALVASLCLFSQGADATARQSEATVQARDAGAGAMIQLAQGPTTKRRKSGANAKPSAHPIVNEKVQFEFDTAKIKAKGLKRGLKQGSPGTQGVTVSGVDGFGTVTVEMIRITSW